ncbi:hypothetical protein PISMIDRAFT_683578 [Pisolithus microcarpus 441]|uniref:Uncharacterized protein n=1 Tax=Pisolithus microcarpus 441 TaxID=765257 RepID=A0A0C9Y2W2_9AGAM|nr:hypothetical protein PISMIDRAFT_683578 [Pisolithus microcarpus 441]
MTGGEVENVCVIWTGCAKCKSSVQKGRFFRRSLCNAVSDVSNECGWWWWGKKRM